jgi:hypothetical protein
MKINAFAYAGKNKPNQTQFKVRLPALSGPVPSAVEGVEVPNLLQTNHPIFKISLKNPLIFNFFLFFPLFFCLLSSVLCLLNSPFYLVNSDYYFSINEQHFCAFALLD